MKDYCIGYFVSPHGFGHAARASAVMVAVRALAPAARFEIFTRVPRWFFQDSLQAEFGYHAVLTDVGLAQETALREDMNATLQRLADLYPLRPALIAQLARQVTDLRCAYIMCDIAPLGIAVARAAGIPSILIENFTWDWIYDGYLEWGDVLTEYSTYLRGLFRQADYHIQTEPVCEVREADLVTRPVSRQPRTPAATIRARLGIPAGETAVLITMGGFAERHAFVDRLAGVGGVHFVIPGAGESMETVGNITLLPHHSEYYHPDLLNACDAVVGKTGYSTVAETYYAGIPFGYVSRNRFREYATLARFIDSEMQGLKIAESQFRDGTWVDLLPRLIKLPRVERRQENGSAQIARFLLDRLD